MSDEFTLEKLKIAEKLDAVNTALAVLTASHENIGRLLEKHNTTLYGDNGTKGMNVRVDRLEQDFEARRWHLRTIWAVILAAIAKILHLSFK